MTLTLTVANVAHLDNGMPTELVLNRRGAVIGRSATCDWSLPDPANFISSRHCEIRFENDGYVLHDLSTNGTLLNGARTRMTEPRRIVSGDRFTIGHYEVEAALSGQSAHAAALAGRGAAADAAAPPAWSGWESHSGAPPPPPAPAPANGWDSLPEADADWNTPVGDSGWGAPASPAAPAAPGTGASIGGWDAGVARGVAGSWEPAAAAGPDPEVRSPWAQAAPAATPASDWSSAAPDHAPTPTPNDVWGAIAEGHVVDWARGGSATPRRDPLSAATPAGAGDFAGSVGGVAGWAPPALPRAEEQQAPVREPTPAANAGWGAPPAPNPPPAPPPTPRGGASSSPPTPAGAAAPHALLAAAGVDPAQISGAPAATIARAGELLRQLVAGLVVMVEARARAKAQMGAETTSFAFAGNNPLKFARTPEQALAQLLNEPERGFMPASEAVQDAYHDLQSHQIATLKAMQGALRATLDRFSPAAIRSRAETGGLLARLPGAREKALWQAYEREFGGVVRDSDEAFMQVFAKEFRLAYEEQSRAGR